MSERGTHLEEEDGERVSKRRICSTSKETCIRMIQDTMERLERLKRTVLLGGNERRHTHRERATQGLTQPQNKSLPRSLTQWTYFATEQGKSAVVSRWRDKSRKKSHKRFEDITTFRQLSPQSLSNACQTWPVCHQVREREVEEKR